MMSPEIEMANLSQNSLNDLKNRGVKDVLFFCADGLSGFTSPLIPSASVLLPKNLGLIPEAGCGQSQRKSNKYRALINMQKLEITV